MKLHLPKTLLVAVLAACVVPAWATSDSTDNSGWDKITNNTGSYAIGDATITSIDTADSESTGDLFIRSNNGVGSATVTTLTVGKNLTIDGWHESNATHPEFSNLTITTVYIGGSSTLAISTGNTVSVGTLNVTGGENIINGSFAAGALSVQQGGKLTLAKNTVMDMTSVVPDSAANSTAHIKNLNDANITTEEGAFIKVKVGTDGNTQELNFNGALTKNFQFANQVTFHGGGTSQRAVSIGSGVTIKADAGMKIVSQGTFTVAGGSLEAQKIILGHTSVADGGHYGKLVMTSGSIKTGSISFYNDQKGNAISISGGYLEFTDSNAIVYEGQTTNMNYERVSISIADATLKASSAAWTLDGKDAAYATISGVTIDAANTQDITLNNVSLGGTITNNGDLTLGSGVTVASGTSVSFEGTGTTTLASALTNNGNLSGSFVIESLQGFEGTGSCSGGKTAGNGYLSGDFQIIKGSNKAGVSIGYGGNTYTTNEEGLITDTDYSTFIINTGTEAITTANGNASTNTIEMANGTTLTVDANFATVRTADGATAVALTVNNATNPTITTLSAAGAEVTVGGTSGLSITNATAETLIANADINLGANAHSVKNLEINDGATVTTTYGNDGGDVAGFVRDSITINGGGTLKHTGNVNSPFGAGDNGINSITLGGTSGKTATLLFNRRTAISSCSLTLKGYSTIGSAAITGAVQATETSNRDNSAVLDFIGDNTVTVSGTNNTINAALRLRNGTTTTFEVNNTTKDDVTTEGSVVLNGNIFKEGNNGSLTKSGDGKLTIASTSAVVHNANVTGGTLEIANGKTLTATGTMTVGAGSTLALSSANAFAVTGVMTFNEGAKLSYTLGAIAAAETGDISYTLGTAGSFIGVDTLKYAGEMEGYTAKFSTVAGGNNTQSLVLTFEQNAITLTETQVTEVRGFADGVLTLKTAVDANKYVFGDTFNVNISAELWETVIAAVAPAYANEFYITMQDAEGNAIDFGTATPAVVFNGQTGTVQSVTTTAGTYSVPEPTTATLSLLALAALAARRRRK